MNIVIFVSDMETHVNVSHCKVTTGFAVEEDLRLLILMKRNQNGRDFERRLMILTDYEFARFTVLAFLSTRTSI